MINTPVKHRRNINRRTNTMNRLHIIGILLVAALLLSACAPQQITVNSQPEKDLLSVSGEGQIDAQPDKAELVIATQTNASTAKEAQAKNREITNAVISSLKGAGVKAEDIETMDYDLQPVYDWNPKTGERVDKGYQLVQRTKVTTQNLEMVGPLIDLVVQSGTNRVDSISFGLTKAAEKQAKSEALAQAAQEAANKAQSIAANVGVSLGKVAKVSESASYQPYYPRFEMYAAKGMMADAAPAPTAVSPKKVTVSATVNLDYEIR